MSRFNHAAVVQRLASKFKTGLCAGCAILIIAGQGFGVSFVTGDEPDRPVNLETTEQLLSVVSQKLIADAYQPPSRQELYLSAVRGMYWAAEIEPPSALAKQVSTMASEEELAGLVRSAWNTISTKKKSDFDPDEVQSGALRSLLKTVNPEASFIDAKARRVNRQVEENQYVGIGVRIALEDGLGKIDHAFFGGPAQVAGMIKGDKITKVNGEQMKDKPFPELIDKLRGKKGTTLSITLENETHAEKTRTVQLTRNVVPIASINGADKNPETGQQVLELAKQLNPNGKKKLAYLRVYSINGSTASEMQLLGNRLQRENFEGLILDFRGVTASDMHHAMLLANTLVGETTLARVATRNGIRDLKTEQERTLPKMKIAVLKDEGVSAPTMLVLLALQKRGNVEFVGKLAISKGIFTQSVDVPGWGAMIFIPSGEMLVVKPENQESTHGTELPDHVMDASGNRLPMPNLFIVPSEPTAAVGNELVTEAAKSFK